MKKAIPLWSSGHRQWLAIARDPDRDGHLIDTNEYVMDDGTTALITDPGGLEIFPAVFSAVAAEIDPSRIEHVFASHQDPDVISSLSLWLAFKPTLTCHLSWLWESFVPHFGGEASTFAPIPDEGSELRVGATALRAIPAHYLHSAGNLHLHDPEARLLFSGDVGAAMLPASAGLFVTDFDRHIVHAEGFHRRWMGSNEARLDWCQRAARLHLELLCPQHGAIYRGRDVERFINWFAELRVGVLRPPRAA